MGLIRQEAWSHVWSFYSDQGRMGSASEGSCPRIWKLFPMEFHTDYLPVGKVWGPLESLSCGLSQYHKTELCAVSLKVHGRSKSSHGRTTIVRV